MSNDKPREWWIVQTNKTVMIAANPIANSEAIRVVEYSSYNNILNRNRELEAEIKLLREPNIYTNRMAKEAFTMGHRACERILVPMIEKENAELKVQVEQLTAEIERLKNG